MTEAWKRVRRGRTDGDPIGSEVSRGKSRSQRKAARDGNSWTPTEGRTRDRLLRQFIKGYDGPRGNSEAYITSAIWCDCGRGMNRRGLNGKTVRCVKCMPKAKVAT